MKLSKKHYYLISIFLLLYYCYFNGLRKIFIPFSAVTIPALLAIVLLLVFASCNGKLLIQGNTDKILCMSWFTIAVYIFINNKSLLNNLVSGGMIQLYIMIAFLMVAANTDGNWIDLWIRLTEFYVLAHAVATIIFYFNSSLFSQFARIMFSGDTLDAVLRYYRLGYMTGLSGHFSTNGMILGIGFLFYFEELLYYRRIPTNERNRKAQIFNLVAMLLVFYALILSSKRAPLLAAVFAICFTAIVYKRNKIARRLLILIAIVIVLVAAYSILQNVIPGLSTIVDKFETLEESDAGVLNGRSGLWQLALTMFGQNPVFGCGFGSYSVYATQAGSITTSAHNHYLQVLSELGIVGLVLYILAFISSAVLAFKKLLKISSNPQVDNETVKALCIALDIQIFTIIYCITATALMYYYILIPFFIACSVARTIQGKGRQAY